MNSQTVNSTATALTAAQRTWVTVLASTVTLLAPILLAAAG